MKWILALAIVAPALAFTTPATAAEQTVKLSVPGMTCASCPYLVKQAISKLDGIKSVEATMDDRSATVVFDDTLATVEKIRNATAAIGYDATVIRLGTGS